MHILGLEFTTAGMIQIAEVLGLVVLLLLLLVSFLSRARVFCQYLQHMTGIQLKPAVVRGAYKRHGRAGVRDLLLDLLIKQDLADPSRRVTPDSEPDTSVFEVDALR